MYTQSAYLTPTPLGPLPLPQPPFPYESTNSIGPSKGNFFVAFVDERNIMRSKYYLKLENLTCFELSVENLFLLYPGNIIVCF